MMESTAKNKGGHGWETHATAVSDGGKGAHPLSSSSNCQEFGLGKRAPTLKNKSGMVPQVRDLAGGVTKAPGSVKYEDGQLEE
ncbi:hypothetical protein NOK12_39530 [Nocardioides sp. OK12]|nr:hypothetical protein NOK12_39530 [Nocardioides sp. OK12]